VCGHALACVLTKGVVRCPDNVEYILGARAPPQEETAEFLGVRYERGDSFGRLLEDVHDNVRISQT